MPDQIFLSIFLVEILFRLFGFGIIYLHDVFNAVDAVVVLISFVLVFMPRDLIQ